MNVNEMNRFLALGELNHLGLFPRLENLSLQPLKFEVDFGLKNLPKQPGFISIRGPRQFGKSTWLEGQLRTSALENGPASSFYLNGDELTSHQDLSEKIRELLAAFSPKAKLKRLFIDEITTVDKWETSIKRLADAGEIRDLLIVTTGSKALDLRRGHERLPGRKGKLERTQYIFTPMSYKIFERHAKPIFGAQSWKAYLLTGGSPIAASELIINKKIPEYLVTLTREWIQGEVAAADRSRSTLKKILQIIFRAGGTPFGYSSLARDAGLANNTVAQGYVQLLQDLMVVAPGFRYDHNKKVSIARFPCQFRFTNTLVALSWYDQQMRTIDDFDSLKETEQAKFLEWLVAQELFRRSAIASGDLAESLDYWQSPDHELDFVIDDSHFIEVKRGQTSALEFSWFSKVFGRQAKLQVIGTSKFEGLQTRGVTIDEFLLGL